MATSSALILPSIQGQSGLAVAKTFLQVNPNANVVILEDASTVGGVWAKEKLYHGLKTNNLLGSYEFSDFPLVGFGEKPGRPIEGTTLYDYFTAYAHKFDLYRRIRFETRVETAEKNGAGWLLTVSSSATKDDPATQIQATKFVCATGLTSQPLIPVFDGQDSFDAPFFHSRYFVDQFKETSKSASVVVLGGMKSAWDVAYNYACQGAQVHMVMRSSGHGPGWVAPPFVTPIKTQLEPLLLIRLLTWLSPCIWGSADGYGTIRQLIHGSWLGRKLVDAFFGILGNDVSTLNGYDKHPETAKLKPWCDAFWVASGISILNYDVDFFELVRKGNIKIHVADVSHLSKRQVHLSDGTTLPADAFVACTGWVSQSPIKFLPKGMERDLGLPHFSTTTTPAANRADHEILHRLPRLASQPPLNPHAKPVETAHAKAPNEPYRLYRFMVPPADLQNRSIAFAGVCLSLNTTLVAQVQALWITAYLGGRLAHLDEGTQGLQDQIAYETILHSQFCKWRYPWGYGHAFPDLLFDSLPYMDLMLGELGLQAHRKQSVWQEWFSPYSVKDYRYLTEEWLVKQGHVRDKCKD